MIVTATGLTGTPVNPGDFCYANGPRVGVLSYTVWPPPSASADVLVTAPIPVLDYILVGRKGVEVNHLMDGAIYQELEVLQRMSVAVGSFGRHVTLTNLGGGRVAADNPALIRWSRVPFIGHGISCVFGDGRDAHVVPS